MAINLGEVRKKKVSLNDIAKYEITPNNNLEVKQTVQTAKPAMAAVAQTTTPKTEVKKTTTKPKTIAEQVEDSNETPNAEGYTPTNKKYGDYDYHDYLKNKDYQVFKKDGKAYYYNPNTNSYIDMDTPRMISKELDKQQYEEAVKNGYKPQKTYNDEGKQVQPSKTGSKVELDTSGLTKKEKEKFTKSLVRQEQTQGKESTYVRKGGTGIEGTIGELQNTWKGIDKNAIQPITRAPQTYEYGDLARQQSMEYYNKMMGKKNKVDEINRKIELYNKFNKDITESNNQLDSYFRNLPNQVSGTVEGIKGAGPFGLIGAAGGATIGAITTKTPTGALVGAEKGAKLLGGAGYVKGQAENTFKLEAGAEYQALLEMGVPEKIAKKEALRVGTENALIESGESILDLITLGKSSVLTEKLTEGLIKKYGLDALKSWGVSYVTNIASEGLEEGLQEQRSISGEKRAAEKAGLQRDDSQDIQRILESAKSGSFDAAISGIGTRTLGVGAKTLTNAALNNVNNQSNINNQVTQNNSLESTKIGNKTALDTVKSLNEAERQALTEITIKRKNGISLDQNDIATINYLNNKDDIQLENEIKQNGLKGELSDVDVEIPGLEGLEKETSLSSQLENRAEQIVQDEINTREAMIKNFQEYLEENNITNPTQKDIDNSIVDLLGYDNEMSNNEKISFDKQYNEVISDYLKNNKNETNVENNQNIKYNTIEEAVEADPRKADYVKYNTSVDFFNLDLNNMQKVIAEGSNEAELASIAGLDNGSYNVEINGKYYEAYFDLLNKENQNNEFGITELIPISEGVENDYDNTKAVDSFLKMDFRGEQESNIRNNNTFENGKKSNNDAKLFTRELQQQRTNETRQTNKNSIKNSTELTKKRTSDSSFSNENVSAIKEGDPYIKITGEEGELYWKDQGANDKVAELLSEVPKKKTITKEMIKEAPGEIYRSFVSKGGEVEKVSELTKRPQVKFTYDRMLRAGAEAQQHIGSSQRDLNLNKYNNFVDDKGKKVSMSLNDIRKDAKTHGISEKTLNQYLLENLNVDRYREGKPVFGKSYTDEMSLEKIANMEKENPQIKRIAQNVWTYEHNELKNTYESGLISKKHYDTLKKYEHYVRIQREMDSKKSNKAVLDRNGRIQVNQGIQTAKGGNQNILPIMENIAKQTQKMVEAQRTNQTIKELASAIGMGSQDQNIQAITNEESFGINPDIVKKNDDGTYTMTYFEDGVATVVPINKGLYDAFATNKTIQSMENNTAFKVLSYLPKKVSKGFRQLVTTYSPTFLLKNPARDINDALFNSKYSTQFTKDLVSQTAVRDILGKGPYSDLYYAAGGQQDSYFQNGRFTDTDNKIKNALKWAPEKIQAANETIETIPRLTEFIATIKANGYEINENGEFVVTDPKKAKLSPNEVLNEALYNAAEVTVNFKRKGDVAAFLDRNGATFLSTSIQGFDKQIRNFKSALTGDKKQMVNVLVKAMAFGVAPTLLNGALHGGDPEYDELPDYQKDNYYIFKIAGMWIRIPKGRAMSVLGSAYRRTKDYLGGKKDAYNGFLKFAADQVAPNSIFKNNIFSAFGAVNSNEAWSGNKIVPDSVANAEHPELEYTSGTDEFSKWLGKKIHYSPAKINYLIDQYSGAIGDLILPNITLKATNKQDLVHNPITNPFLNAFTVDPSYSNKNTSEFYEALEKAKNDSDKRWEGRTAVDGVRYKYLNSKSSDISKLNKQIEEIQSSTKLTKNEKVKQVKELKDEINKIAKEAVKESKNIKEKQYYMQIGDNYYYKKQDENGEITYQKATAKQVERNKYALADYFRKMYYKSKESD